MGGDTDYWHAWLLWWQGQDVRMMTLYGFPMIWVARTAKVLSFVGGLTVVLDLIGPVRLLAFAVRVRKTNWKRFTPILVLVPGIFGLAAGAVMGRNNEVAPGLVLAVALGGLVAAATIVGPSAIHVFGRLIEDPSGERAARWFAIVLIVVGFSFDLLTS